MLYTSFNTEILTNYISYKEITITKIIHSRSLLENLTLEVMMKNPKL